MVRPRVRKRKLDDVQGMAPIRRALAARVSTEDQAERGTIKAQLDFLRMRTELDNKAREIQGLPPIIVAGEYLDDGVSGTIPIADRPDGKRLVDDGRAGMFEQVMWYRLDRMGRSLTVLMDAHDQLERSGVTVISATEPFDTSTPFGKAMFQFLGLIAELEKSTIAERFSRGRDRAVRDGKWTNGVIPFGFDVDADGYLILSDRIVPETGMTESEIASQIFERISLGETLGRVCRWLNALGVPTDSRYPNGRVRRVKARAWVPARVQAMIHRTTYSGVREYDSRFGAITGDVPALVTPELQQAAIEALQGNLSLPTNGRRFNLLRGLLICGTCDAHYVGFPMKLRNGTTIYYYRCGNDRGGCKAKLLPADEVEREVCDYVRQVARNPGAEIEQAQADLRQRSDQSAKLAAEQDVIVARLRELSSERERIMTLFHRGHASLEETEAKLSENAERVGAQRAELEAIRAQRDLAEASEARLVTAAAALAKVAEEFDRVPRERQQRIIAALIPTITVRTIELERRGKRAVKDYQLEARTIVGGHVPESRSTMPSGTKA